MVTCFLFLQMDMTLKRLAPVGLQDMPFGGRTVILFGDFGQLQPVGGMALHKALVLTWLQRNNLQFDVSGGIGISDAADDWYLGAGASLRLPR